MQEHMCEMCGAAPATVHFSQTVNGVTTERRLCADCAKQLQIINLEGFLNPANIIASAMGAHIPPKKQRVCRCGTTEADLARDLKFGCEECYGVFSDYVERFLAGNINAVHKGKVPGGGKNSAERARQDASAGEREEDELSRLQRELRDAVAKEDYDLAALLHKKIKALEKKNGG